MKQINELRATTRRDIGIPVEVLRGKSLSQATTRNLSMEGACIRLTEPCAAGEKLNIVLRPERSAPIHLQGMVLSASSEKGARFKFERLSTRHRVRLLDCLFGDL